MGRTTYIFCLFLVCAVIPGLGQLNSACDPLNDCNKSLLDTSAGKGIRMCRGIVEYISCVQKIFAKCPSITNKEANEYMPMVSKHYNDSRCPDLLMEITTAPEQSHSTSGYHTSEHITPESSREATEPFSTPVFTTSSLMVSPKTEVTPGVSTEIGGEKQKNTLMTIVSKPKTFSTVFVSTPRTEVTSDRFAKDRSEHGKSSMMTFLSRSTSMSDGVTSQQTPQKNSRTNTDTNISTTTKLGSTTSNIDQTSSMYPDTTTVVADILNTESGIKLASTNAMTSSRTMSSDASTGTMTTPLFFKQSSTNRRDVSTEREIIQGNTKEVTSFRSVTSDASTQSLTSLRGYSTSNPKGQSSESFETKGISTSSTKGTSTSTIKDSVQQTGKPNEGKEENLSSGGNSTNSVEYVLAMVLVTIIHWLS